MNRGSIQKVLATVVALVASAFVMFTASEAKAAGTEGMIQLSGGANNDFYTFPNGKLCVSNPFHDGTHPLYNDYCYNDTTAEVTWTITQDFGNFFYLSQVWSGTTYYMTAGSDSQVYAKVASGTGGKPGTNQMWEYDSGVLFTESLDCLSLGDAPGSTTDVMISSSCVIGTSDAPAVWMSIEAYQQSPFTYLRENTANAYCFGVNTSGGFYTSACSGGSTLGSWFLTNEGYICNNWLPGGCLYINSSHALAMTGSPSGLDSNWYVLNAYGTEGMQIANRDGYCLAYDTSGNVSVATCAAGGSSSQLWRLDFDNP